MTARLNNAGSSMSGEKPRAAKTPTGNQSQASVIRTPPTVCLHLCTDFFSKMITSWQSGWSTALHDLCRLSLLYFARNLQRFIIYPSVNYLSLGTYWPIRYSLAGLTEGLKSVRRVCRRVFLVSLSSPLGHTTLPPLLLYTANAICICDD